MRKTDKNGLNRRNKGSIGQVSLPPASVSVRGRLAAVVSLISDFHLIDSVGVFAGGRRNDEIMRKTAQKLPKWVGK